MLNNNDSLIDNDKIPSFIKSLSNTEKITPICQLCSLTIHIYILTILTIAKLTILSHIFMLGTIINLLVCFSLKNKKYSIVYFVDYTEILLINIFATIFLGSRFYFILYLLAIIPLSFYYTYMTNQIKHKIKVPMLCASTSFVLILLTNIYISFRGTVYDIDKLPVYLYALLNLFNMLTAFLLLAFFSCGFIMYITNLAHELELKNKSLENLANYDQLTGLINRHCMRQKFELIIDDYDKNNTPFSIIMGDIDNFKIINDTHGHDCGDYVLREVSRLIKEILTNSYICRWGGEEILMATYYSSNEAYDKAELIRDKIDKHCFEYNYQVIHVTITLGIEEYSSINSLSSTIIAADNKMYYGKSTTKNCVIV